MDNKGFNNQKTNRRKNTEIITPMDTLGRKAPAATELEQAVLGAMLLDREAILRIQEVLKPEYFFEEKNQWVYKSIQILFDKNDPIDILTVIDKLKSLDKLEFVGGEYYISELSLKVTSSANIEYHSHIILQKYVQRQLIQIAGQTIKEAYEPSSDAFSLLDETEKQIYEIKNQGMKRSYVDIQSLVSKALKQIEENTQKTGDVTGVPSGIASVDRITSGWQPSDLIILAGRPGMGKTAFALTMLRNAAMIAKKPVAFFSLEMSAVQLVTRLISSEAEISSEDLRRGNLKEHQWQQIIAKTAALGKAPIFIDDTPSLSIFELKAKARRLHSQHGIEMIMVDYLQLMKGDDVRESKMNREQEISYISRSLKNIAKELNIPVLALAQLSRETEKRADKTPQLSDLRESGSIEQDADLVTFIFRDDYYNRDNGVESEETGGIAKLLVRKNRHGAQGDADMHFVKKLQRFVDASEANIAPIVRAYSRMNDSDDVDDGASFEFSAKPDKSIFDKGTKGFDNPFANEEDNIEDDVF